MQEAVHGSAYKHDEPLVSQDLLLCIYEVKSIEGP